MKISDRKKKILQIVVDEYINTAVPVSSKTITEKHLGGVSSATVRNELASLEELGYLTQFHTSGGRVPSPAAYRGDKKALLVIVTGERILRDSFVDIPEDMTAEDLEGVSKTLCKVFFGALSLRGERGRGGSLIGIFAV
mgnify:CR=1 FL=1